MKKEGYEVKTLVVGQLQTNCYLVFDRTTKEVAIIDPGDDSDYIISQILQNELVPKTIIATHGHFDHILAATDLQLTFEIPFLIHKKDTFLVTRMRRTAGHFLGTDSGPEPIMKEYLREGMKVYVGDASLEVAETPGHTPGSVGLKSRGIVFVGDTIFAGGGKGRDDFSYSNSVELEKSIKKVLRLPKDTVIFSGHGPASNIETERKFFKI